MKVVGYSDPLSVAPGDKIGFMVSCENEAYRADVVKLRRGGKSPSDPDFKETHVPSSIEGEYRGRVQEIHVGSYALVPDSPLLQGRRQLTITAWIYPTTPLEGTQGLVTKWAAGDGAGYGLVVNQDGELALRVGDGSGTIDEISTGQPLGPAEWYFVAGTIDLDAGRMSVHQIAGSWWRAEDHLVNALDSMKIETIADNDSSLLIAASMEPGSASRVDVVHHFNGKIESPRLFGRSLSDGEIISMASGQDPDGIVAAWDFSREISSNRITDTSGNAVHGHLVNLPTRAVTGHNWSGREADFRQAPGEYGAIHFHDDDLENANWESDFEFEVPPDLQSGIYAARLRTQGAQDYVPFYVRSPKGRATAPILFLAPTLTYMAYGNEHFDELPPERAPHMNLELCPEEYGYIKEKRLASMYDVHPDGSGHWYFSRLRPVLNMRPTYYNRACDSPFSFSADLHITDWLEEMGHDYDVATDEDLHSEGAQLLSRYKVVLTGTHPEYYSGDMLDALEGYLEKGGRLMYLGGNGFYWITSFDPQRPHIIEMRRRQGTRTSEAGPGEYHHSTTGEPGGLWRYWGRPPQRLVGIGFTAQGIDSGSPYRRQPGSFHPDAEFIFEGVGAEETIGDFESPVVKYGAAGLELDRHDRALGSPSEAIVLASSYGHSDFYHRVVEEVGVNSGNFGGTVHPEVRSDLVYFKTPNDGAVFSVGSIAWCASLSYDNYENNVARITGNVLNRFVADGEHGQA